MKLILVGCEYSGKKTLAVSISRWLINDMGLDFVRWHNHFVVPKLDTHMIIKAVGKTVSVGKNEQDINNDADERQIMSLRPAVLEQLQRHNIWRHLHHKLFKDADVMFINHYYADAVYAPIYYNYGSKGSFADRISRAREWDSELLEIAPDVVLVLVKASADIIRKRLKENCVSSDILQSRDVDNILKDFQQQYDDSLITRKFVLDTTRMSIDEMLEQFKIKIRPYLTKSDNCRILNQRSSFLKGR